MLFKLHAEAATFAASLVANLGAYLAFWWRFRTMPFSRSGRSGQARGAAETAGTTETPETAGTPKTTETTGTPKTTETTGKFPAVSEVPAVPETTHHQLGTKH